MDNTIELNIWTNLALDICPNCQHQGLWLKHQTASTAILVCQKCSSEYCMSAIRQKGAYQIQKGKIQSINFPKPTQD